MVGSASRIRPAQRGIARHDAPCSSSCLNGLQLGVLLFLLSAGLTLIFGIMDLVNLAHGSLYMVGAFAPFAACTGSLCSGLLALVTALMGGLR